MSKRSRSNRRETPDPTPSPESAPPEPDLGPEAGPRPGWHAGLLALFALAMLSPLIFAGKVFFFRDFGLYYHPLKRYFLNRVLDGSFPLWCPEMNCGTPLHGELVHGFLYPLNALLFLGAGTGWGLYFAAHLLLAGLGARRLALRFGATADAALAAGIAFAGSGYLVSQMNHVPYASAAAWAPLLISLIMDLKDRRRATVPLLAVGLAMAALAGEPFTVLLTLFFAGVVILGGFAGPRLPAILKTGMAGAIALLLASPSLIPAYQQLGESVRSEGWGPNPSGFGSLHPIRFATVLAPEAMGRIQSSIRLPVPFFGGELDIYAPVLLGIHLGAVTLLALLLAPIRASRATRWLLSIVVVATLLSLGPHFGLAPWLASVVPGLEVFRYPDKYWFLATLAAAPLLGVALPRLRPEKAFVAALICAGVAFVVSLGTQQMAGALTGAIAFALVAAAFRLPKAIRVRALTAVLAVELLFFGIRLNPCTDPARLSPMHPNGIGALLKEERPGRIFDDLYFPDMENTDEVMPFQYQHLQAMAGVPDGFHYTTGYDPVEPLARTSEFFRVIGEMPAKQRNEIWHRLLRLTATTHSVTSKPIEGDREVELRPHLQRTDGVRVLTYLRPAPRVRLYGKSVYVRDWSAGRQLIQDLSFDPFRILVLEGNLSPDRAGDPRGRVEFTEDTPHRVCIEVESDRAAWLLLMDAYAEGWQATVNGEPAEIRVGMAAFRAVRVPKGASVVEFRYRPGWLRIVPFTAGLGLALLGFAFFSGGRRRGRSEA